ncbi:MAG: hypothetical protein H6600_05365 [Flavobacteriales bacterium]|nr:hypothetical protein [Flavobacteriales bacterium]
MKKLKNLKNTGFSSKGEFTGSRLLNADGSSNVKKVGLSFFDRFHLYHTLISMKSSHFFGLIFLIYILINVIFAIGYMLVGVDYLVDSNVVQVESTFLRAFFFSSQTLTTLGYGQMSPTGVGANIIASLEAFVGLLLFSLLTGLLYGRFSRPRARLIYSDNVLVSPYPDTGKGLMVRFANPKNTSIINVEASMLFSYMENVNGENVREYYSLELEMSKIKMLATSWTLVHPMGEESPIKSMSLATMKAKHAELIVQIEGYDETYNQQVSSRVSFSAGQIIYGAKFDRAFIHTDAGMPYLDFEKMSTYTLVDLD